MQLGIPVIVEVLEQAIGNALGAVFRILWKISQSLRIEVVPGVLALDKEFEIVCIIEGIFLALHAQPFRPSIPVHRHLFVATLFYAHSKERRFHVVRLADGEEV